MGTLWQVGARRSELVPHVKQKAGACPLWLCPETGLCRVLNLHHIVW